MDKFRRSQNKDFAREIFDLVASDAERSFSESSDDEINDGVNGKLIHMNIWLGQDKGHVSLVGLATDKPTMLANKFAKKHRLSIGAQLELRHLISRK